MADPVPASSDIDLRPLIAELKDLRKSVDILRPKRADTPVYSVQRIAATVAGNPARVPGRFTSICILGQQSGDTYATVVPAADAFLSLDGSNAVYRIRRGMVLSFPEPVTGFLAFPAAGAWEIATGLDVDILDHRSAPPEIIAQVSSPAVALGAGATVTVCSVGYGATPSVPVAYPIQWRARIRCTTAGNVRIIGATVDGAGWQEQYDMTAGELVSVDVPTHITRDTVASGHAVRAISAAGFVGVVSASLRVMAT